MKVYIVKEYSDGFNDEARVSIAGVFAKYEDAEERAEDLAEYGGLETDVYKSILAISMGSAREKDIWYLNDIEMVSIETHELQGVLE